MKYFFKTTTLVFLLTFTFYSCSSKDEVEEIIPEPEEEFVLTTEDEINRFIWTGLNTYYLWQDNVPDLSDTKFTNYKELYLNFRKFSNPETTFDALLYKKGEVDRFSWIVDNYVELENSFQGISKSNGMEFGLVQNSDGSENVFGYVRYVVANSSASENGVKRGMYFNTINGTNITISNYRDLLFGENSTTYTIGLANYNSGFPTSTGNSITLTKTELQENPVAVTETLNEGGKKIGYLMYNQFSASFDGQLNAAFAKFKADNIDELIVDLRYNGGGSVRSAIYLGSMITGQFNNQVYSRQRWNSKVIEQFGADYFKDNFTNRISNTDGDGNVILDESINSLNLDKAYFIVSGNTASASELVINALNAYIDVKIIGVTTVGKQVGSITLYDSEDLQRTGKNLNAKHAYAMQPIVLEIVNKNNENDIDGYTPGVDIPGVQIAEDYGNLGELGKTSDPLLNAAVNLITTGSKGNFNSKTSIHSKEIYNSSIAKPMGNNMYIELKDLKLK
ncbi:S41 family peptidase [Polaribacter septentrionalilitoris]|uniref:S41 family peptidase n=1 Tax=Polaribacter septentrionalilitoris TaxID=2494657 RepID=UPI0013593231|nr:S41 family peptidase [Polaribacter septentrionalilitoris]